MPDGEKKQTVGVLVSAYQSAVEAFIDYAHFAVYDERRANNASMHYLGIFSTGKHQANIWVNPAVDDQKNRAVTESLAHQYLDEQIFEVSNALHALKLPEHRYDRICPNRVFSSYDVSGEPAASMPCDLSRRFAQTHAAIEDIAKKAYDADYTARRTHRTPRWKPYKRIEIDWFGITMLAGSALDALAELPVSLDDLRDGRSKKAALDITAAYQNALMKIVNYAHYAVFYERISNQTGGSVRDKDIWTFGVIRGTTKSNYDAYSRNDLESQGLTLGDALRSIKLPEYRYREACASFARFAPMPQLRKITDPCMLAERFRNIRKTFDTLKT